MQQLGRMDIINEDGTVEPYSGTSAQLFARGNRAAFTLPPGNEKEQDMIFSYNDFIKEEKRLNKKARERLTARVEQHRAEAAKKSEKNRNL